MNSIGERIKVRLDQLGMSQGELGRQMVASGFPHWNHMTAFRTVSDQRHLRLDEAYPLAQILCTTVDYLAGATSDPGTSPAARRVVARAIKQLTELQETL